jgi:hypothetical protein
MNVQEVINIAKQRESRNKTLTKKIIENIHKKIKYYATMHKESCTYIVPPIIDDTLISDLNLTIKEIFKTLDSEGYIVNAYSNGQIDICWNEKLVEQKVKTDNYLLKEHEYKLKNLSKINKQIDSRYGFLANPKKVNTEKSVEQKLDDQVEKILAEKNKNQKKFSLLLNK